MASNIPVRRPARTTRAAVKDAENNIARVTRPTTRAKTLAAAATATTSTREPVFTRPPSSTVAKAKLENGSVATSVKTRRGALLEVTKQVTNNNAGKVKATAKGKEKETDVAPTKTKPVLVDVRKPLQDAARPITRRTIKPISTAAATVTKPTVARKTTRQIKSAASIPKTISEKPRQPATRVVKSSVRSAPETQPIAPSSLRKRTSNLDDDPMEEEREFKRQHTERDVEMLPPRDESQLEVDTVAADLVHIDIETVPVQATSEQLWTDLDADDIEDPLMASEYIIDICDYWKRIELESLPNSNYMDYQKELSWHFRSVLVDWLIEVHGRFRFLQETLFLCVNILDRFLSVRSVSVAKFQLVGVACLLIACKYEETCSPSVNEMAYITQGQYQPDEIIRAEQYVLKALDWDLKYPGPLGWLRRGSKADDYEEKARTIAKYLMEIGCMERKLISTTPSKLAAAALWFARLVIGREEWTPNLAHYTTYTEAELMPTVNHILNYILQPTTYQVLYKKYASKKYMKCSIYLNNWARQRWSEGTAVELGKHVEWLKADVRTLRKTRSTNGDLEVDSESKQHAAQSDAQRRRSMAFQ
ncbi:hypothetical protein AMATHDRAFT_66250 [Amanita thiersii Skay4041]|uniref:Uncharacterized protein n=1 Tax=Amanita thiersii Skay4041 TaxID=703135 RepID=A0A2A9NAP4_9AGAR|nr:hypothetical protein AMATHDRAFT_66250 [Amanita thiersii Skay4041]